MLSNCEFSVSNKVPTLLSGELAEFAMFTLDLGDSRVCKGRNKAGKRVMKIENPHLTGKGVHLFDVVPVSQLTIKQIKELEDKEAELDRKARVKLYASRGWAFEEPDSLDTQGEDEESPQNEWDRFFADDVPMQGGKCRRKGGVRNNSTFEGLVDSAQ